MPSGIYERRPFTETHRENIRLGMLGNQNFVGTSESEKKRSLAKVGNHNALGHHFHPSKVMKERMRIAKIGKPSNALGKRWKLSGKALENVLRSIRENLAKHSGTYIELRMEKELNKNFVLDIIPDYQKQVKIGRSIVDFLISKQRLILECYGKHWHSGFAKRYRDMKRKEKLEKLGYTVLVFWSKEIMDRNFNLEKVLKERGLLNV